MLKEVFNNWRRFLTESEQEQEQKEPWNNGWDVVAHHITLYLGKPKEDIKNRLGEQVTLSTQGYLYDDKIMAVYIPKEQLNSLNLPCKNDYPHITMAKAKGVSAKESNNLFVDKEGYFKKNGNKTIDNESMPATIDGTIEHTITPLGQFVGINISNRSRAKLLSSFGLSDNENKDDKVNERIKKAY